MRRFARALTFHREDADDLVQIAMARALGRSEQWEPGTRLDSWLFRIIKHAWIDEVRSRTRRERKRRGRAAGTAASNERASIRPAA